MSSYTLTIDFFDLDRDSSTLTRDPLRGRKISSRGSSLCASSTKSSTEGWSEIVQTDLSEYLENSFSEDNIHLSSDLSFNFELIRSISESELFSEELDPEFSRILAQHNLKGKKKRTRW